MTLVITATPHQQPKKFSFQMAGSVAFSLGGMQTRGRRAEGIVI